MGCAWERTKGRRLLLSQDRMGELTSAKDNHGGNRSHGNDSSGFDDWRGQLHHKSMVLLACHLFVFNLIKYPFFFVY